MAWGPTLSQTTPDLHSKDVIDRAVDSTGGVAPQTESRSGDYLVGNTQKGGFLYGVGGEGGRRLPAVVPYRRDLLSMFRQLT